MRGRGGGGDTPEEEGHWDARNESLLVPRRNGALGRPDRHGTKARRVPARVRGVRIGQQNGKRDSDWSGCERARGDPGGYDRRTARRVINNPAAAPALFPSLAFASFLFLRFVSTALSPSTSSHSSFPMVPRVRASLETAYRSRQKTLGCSLTLDRRRLPRARRIDDYTIQCLLR